MKGRLIVLEGIDGAGKTSCAKALCEGKADWIHVPSPSSLPYGAQVRRILRGEEPYPGPWPMQMLFGLDRYNLCDEVVIPALDRGKTVLCDRWWYSSVCYGTYEGLYEADLETMYKHIPVQPDLLLHLQVDPKLACAREGKGEGPDYFDGNIRRQEEIARIYDRLLTIVFEHDSRRQITRRSTLCRMRLVSANQSAELVQQACLEQILATNPGD